MRQIIVASHGKLAEGIVNSANFFGIDEIDFIEQTMEDSNFMKRAEELLIKYQSKKIIVFTDIAGGSVNQIFTMLLNQYDFYLITGVNLGMLLEVSLRQEINEEAIREIVETTKNQIIFMNDYIKQIQIKIDED
ncbi:MAG TPA: hypothetical protein PLT36_01000 [Erysipelotrichaceae bacterium]|jgi:fructoselysine and glucoselysine-specific PTS system IIA component|nr:hypothetical protein [Erysipelotrichia bacterium]HPX32068.1 hypothetical protein [Erysipelotrichaceae bacterium]HQA84891.1 hypothetical protein [Erysipelotrichaceae bacterium]